MFFAMFCSHSMFCSVCMVLMVMSEIVVAAIVTYISAVFSHVFLVLK